MNCYAMLRTLTLAGLAAMVVALAGCPEEALKGEEDPADINGPMPAKELALETDDSSVHFSWKEPTEEDSVFNRDLAGFVILRSEGAADYTQPPRQTTLAVGDEVGTQIVVGVVPAEPTTDEEIEFEWTDLEVEFGVTNHYQFLSFDEIPNYSDPLLLEATPGSLAVPRLSHAQALLADGRVLLTGGLGYGGPLDSAEIFDPSAGLIRAVSTTMKKRRFGHTATPLSDGRVLLVGGYEEGFLETLDSAEFFDSVNETFRRAGSAMAFGRALHTATLLADGRVLIAGGTDGVNAFPSAEIFDPDTETFTLLEDSMSAPRYSQTATSLLNLVGDPVVMLAGGMNDTQTPASVTFLNTASFDFGLFDPIPDQEEDPMPVGRMSHTATLLPDGRVVLVGGFSGTLVAGAATDSIVIFDPADGTFTEVAFLALARSGHQAALLPDGRVMTIGGIDEDLNILNTTEIFDPATNAVSAGPSLNVPRTVAQLTPLPDGTFFLAGGNASSDFFLPHPVSTAEILDPTSLAWALFPAQ